MSSTSSDTSHSAETRKIFTLLDVCSSISATLSKRYTSAFWLKAQMQKINRNASGHCYPSLYQKEGEKIVAQMSATIWKSDFEKISLSFAKEVGIEIKEEMEYLFLAKISYSPIYGISLNIIDIDRSFALGKLHEQKKLCIERLKKEGLWDRQKMLSFPLIPKRIAIISAESARGYSDFVQVLGRNPSRFNMSTKLFSAVLQGDAAVESILSVLSAIETQKEKFDVVAIIRGGGDEIGMSCYDNYSLCSAIAKFPLPVLCGIGHSTDNTVCAQISYFNAITPTDLGVYIWQAFESFERKIVECIDSILLVYEAIVGEEYRKLDKLTLLLQNSSIEKLSQEKLALDLILGKLPFLLERNLEPHKAFLKEAENLMKLIDPKNVLKRGYSLVYKDGKLLKDKAELEALSSQDIELELRDGRIKVRVE